MNHGRGARPTVSARLRIVVLLDSPPISAWIREVLLGLSVSPHATIVLAVFDGSRSSDPATSPAFRLYEHLDRRLSGGAGDATEDAVSLLDQCPQLHSTPVARGPTFELPADDVETIRAARPDAILKLGFPPLTGALLDVARLGVWSFDHVEDAKRGVPAFAGEQLQQRPTIELRLRSAKRAAERILARAHVAADRTFLHRTREMAYAKSVVLLSHALRDAEFPAAPDDEPPAAHLAAPQGAPGAGALLRFAANTAVRVARNRWRQQRSECLWFVALRPAREPLAAGSVEGFRPLAAPAGRFFADPFLVEDGARLWLFLEDASLTTRKGVIRCAEVEPDGSLGESRVVLECYYHLSYPFVFRSGGDWFLMPETSAHRTVELWRAIEFPWRWELENVLLHEVEAVDSTLVEHGGRLWLFTGLRSPGGGPHDALHVFHADSLFGDWQPHARNPVVWDLRRARPAGHFFVEDGHLHRPAQDASDGYGSAMWILRVDALDEATYRETPIRRIDPRWTPGAIATHTLNRAGGFDAIDARVWVPRGRSLP